MLFRPPLATFLAIALPCWGEVEEELTWGIETVTGLRSNYVFRGFQRADATLEAQIETEVALGNDTSLGLAAWHIAESSDDFAETALGVNLRRDFADFALTASLDYRSYSDELFQNGIDLGLEARWFLNDDWDLSARAHYDTGAEGAYFALESGWSRPLSEDLFVSARSGLSAVSNYYERSGLNDFYGRISLTYNINSFLSLSPFLGYSLGMAEDTQNRAFAGLWLAVSF